MGAPLERGSFTFGKHNLLSIRKVDSSCVHNTRLVEHAGSGQPQKLGLNYVSYCEYSLCHVLALQIRFVGKEVSVFAHVQRGRLGSQLTGFPLEAKGVVLSQYIYIYICICVSLETPFKENQ